MQTALPRFHYTNPILKRYPLANKYRAHLVATVGPQEAAQQTILLEQNAHRCPIRWSSSWFVINGRKENITIHANRCLVTPIYKVTSRGEMTFRVEIDESYCQGHKDAEERYDKFVREME